LIYFYKYTDNPTGGGSVLTAKNDDFEYSESIFEVIFGAGNRGFFGYCQDDKDRVDVILKRSEKLTVEKTKRGHYKISGHPKDGIYTVWIDPAHGHQIVKATFKKRVGDVFSTGDTLTKNVKIDYEYVVDNLKLIQGVWLPEKSHKRWYLKSEDKTWTDARKTSVRSEIVINPDFDNPPVFVPDDIDDGSELTVRDKTTKLPARLPTFIWQQGKLMPKKENN
jgi:hypothetical protein